MRRHDNGSVIPGAPAASAEDLDGEFAGVTTGKVVLKR
jgi:hypothetical protein